MFFLCLDKYLNVSIFADTVEVWFLKLGMGDLDEDFLQMLLKYDF